MSFSVSRFKIARPSVGVPLAVTTTEGDCAGVRPSSGAAGSDSPKTLESCETPLLADIAAPGDGRTPGVWLRSAPAILTVCTLLAALGGLVLFWFDPSRYHFYPVCLFHKTTGLLCPGCGGLRGLHQLLHGHLAAAFRFNPMLVASLPLLFWFGARYGLQAARNQPASPGLRPVWLWLTLAVVLVVSLLRNLPGTPFAMLRP